MPKANQYKANDKEVKYLPKKSILIQGKWDRMRSRLVPLEAGGTIPKGNF